MDIITNNAQCTGQITQARALLESAEDLTRDVNKYALRPLAPGDFRVFTMDLCNNQIDHHFSRFPEEELSRMVDMVPGRPLMELHDRANRLPRGTFFRSALAQEGDVVSIRADVYVLNIQENQAMIANIDGGVYRETSVGFSFGTPECSVCGKDIRNCKHVPGNQYKGESCHYVMRDVSEIIEGSLVPAGSQGTRFVAARSDTPEVPDYADYAAQIEALKDQLSATRLRLECVEIGLDHLTGSKN